MAERTATERSPGKREAITEFQNKPVGFDFILICRARMAHEPKSYRHYASQEDDHES
jgi:hypothetical protein